jgi:hypothetical protein
MPRTPTKKRPRLIKKGPRKNALPGVGLGRFFSEKKYRWRNFKSLRQKEKDLQRGHATASFNGGKILLGDSRFFCKLLLGMTPLHPEMTDAGTVQNVHASLLVI